MTDLSDADLKAAEPSTLVKLAASLQGITGLLVALSGLQVVIGLTFRHPLAAAIPYLFLFGGVAQIGLAAMVFRARAWAAFAAAGLGGLLAIAMIGWLFYVFPDIASCLQMVGTPLSALTALMSVLAIGGVREAAAARRRLSDQGMSLGL